MSDEPNAIAQAGDYRVLADGKMEYFYHNDIGAHEATWGDPVRMSQEQQDLAALLADLYRRVREELKEYALTLHEGQTQETSRLRENLQRVQSLAVRNSGDIARERAERKNADDELVDRLTERIEAVERMVWPSDPPKDGRVQALSLHDRLAAVEQKTKDVGASAKANIQELFDRVLRVERALEARQKSGAGEGASTVPQGAEQSMPSTADIEANARRETAREIAERLRVGPTAPRPEDQVPVRTTRNDVADWIKREYLKED